MTCPSCLGRKTVMTHVYGERDGGRFGEFRPMACSTCAGSGTIDEAHAARLTAGRELADDRKARGMTLRAEAARLGISPKELSDREWGRTS